MEPRCKLPVGDGANRVLAGDLGTVDLALLLVVALRPRVRTVGLRRSDHN